MGRVKVRDQYGAEHWVEPLSLRYAPWRDYKVIEREDDTAPEAGPSPQAGSSPQVDQPSTPTGHELTEQPPPAPPAAGPELEPPVAEPAGEERPAKPRKSAAE